MNKKQKQKEDEISKAAQVCDLIEFQISNAIKLRISELGDDKFHDDELCNTLFNILRQASVLEYSLVTSIMGVKWNT